VSLIRKLFLPFQLIDLTISGPVHTGVELKAQKQDRGHQVLPDHKSDQGPDRTVEFVVSGEIAEVDGKSERNKDAGQRGPK